MKINLDSDKLRLLRKERFWSQEQVAEMAGISPRTIQRIENGSRASQDSAAALANIYDVTIKDLVVDEDKYEPQARKSKEMFGLELSFRVHLISFLMGAGSMLLINLLTNPADWWSLTPVGFWAIGLLCHGGTVFLVKSVEKMKLEMKEKELAG